MKLLSKLEIKQIQEKEFKDTIKLLNIELGKDRVRSEEFLYKKFKQFPQLFIGIFLDNELMGIICGFPREDYLLISELAIDFRFQKRGFGKRLVEEFEKQANKRYNQINVGAEDNAVKFYESLLGYKPLLLIQFEKKNYSDESFDNFDIIKKYDFDEKNRAIEVITKKADINLLSKLRKKYPKAWFQYIFIKKLK
jgi:ribosomal protein S18 acetylase RimI-like enzyme